MFFYAHAPGGNVIFNNEEKLQNLFFLDQLKNSFAPLGA